MSQRDGTRGRFALAAAVACIVGAATAPAQGMSWVAVPCDDPGALPAGGCRAGDDATDPGAGLLGTIAGLPPPDAAGTVREYVLTVEGQPARGFVGVPADPDPSVLVVLCHGFNGTAFGYRSWLQDLANRDYLAVAMDYRGAQGDWKVWTGWQDTVAATLDLKARNPSITTTILLGQSMGGEVSGLALAYAPPLTYQFWIEGAGVQNLTRQWESFPPFRAVIERETGGRPDQVPDAYRARSPTALGLEISAHRLQRAFITHSKGDGIVPYAMATEMRDVLLTGGTPVSLYTILQAGHVGYGYPIVLNEARLHVDWPLVPIEGTASTNQASGFDPPISPVVL